MSLPSWHWQEFIQRGTDYNNLAEVEAYDARMGRLRDVEGGLRRVLATLRLAPDDEVLEIGTGTGAFALAAARVCRHVYACDVSEMMLAYAQQKAAQQGIANASFHAGGFLTYEHTGEPVSAVVSQLALHHLPDFWKGVALTRVAQLLRPAGRFYLEDIIFSVSPGQHAEAFDAAIAGAPEESRGNWERHLAHEFSTCDWIMEGLLTRAGLTIAERTYSGGVHASYLCVKG